jgi:transcriptional regulator with XRE-family HTH domain
MRGKTGMTNAEMGLRLTRLREARGHTTVSLGRQVGLSQAQVSRLENGRQGFRSATITRIAEALGVPAFYFFMDDDEWETYQAGRKSRGRPPLEAPVPGPAPR